MFLAGGGFNQCSCPVESLRERGKPLMTLDAHRPGDVEENEREAETVHVIQLTCQ